MTTHLEVRPDGVAVITLDNAPVNTLASTLVKSMNAHLAQCASDPKVKAICLTGKGKMFCGGAAVDEMGKGGMAAGIEMINNLHAMIMGLDESAKPTVAAINGQALGGGCETTLGCHYRVAHESTKIGTPEVKLGLLPGGQGTQRLPRLVPFEVACQMMVTGDALNSKVALRAGLIDKVVPDKENLVDAACEFVLSKNGKTRPISKMEPPSANKVKAMGGGLDMVALQVSKVAPKGSIAPYAILECVKQAIFEKNFQEGVQFEMGKFGEMLMSPESAALRNIFFSERAAQKIVGLKTKPQKITKVGIVGSGLMGGGIAMCFIKKGIPVVLKDAKQEWLDAGMKTIKKNYEITVSKGKMKPEKMKQLLSLITPTIDYADFKDVDFVIEAIPEIMPLKKQVFQELGKSVPKHCIVCTNTSGLDIDEIAEAFPDPTRCMGAHFFSPANVMPLLENVRTKKASDLTIATAMEMGKLIGKKAVLVRVCDGFVGNRMMGPYAGEARVCGEEGAGLEQLDTALTEFGFPMGPMTLGDMVGLELFWKGRKAANNMELETKVSRGPFELENWLCDNGRFGVKTGRGMYLYDAKTRKKLKVDPEVVKKGDELRAAKKITPRPFDLEEIQERCMYSLINEGFKILEEGVAQRPSDIDIVWVYGYGFPPMKGGPMHYADRVGLDVILEKLKKFGAHCKQRAADNSNVKERDYWIPSKLLEDCVKEGKTLAQYWKEKEKAMASKL